MATIPKPRGSALRLPAAPAAPATRPLADLPPDRGYLAREMQGLARAGALAGDEDIAVLKNGTAQLAAVRLIVDLLETKLPDPTEVARHGGGGGRHTYERAVRRAVQGTPETGDRILVARGGVAVSIAVDDISGNMSAEDILTAIKTVDGSGSGLDADLLDGQSSAYYTDISARLGFTPLNATAYTAADVLSKLLAVDGTGSGLDADLLDGQSGAYYLARANHTGTLTVTSGGTGTATAFTVGNVVFAGASGVYTQDVSFSFDTSLKRLLLNQSGQAFKTTEPGNPLQLIGDQGLACTIFMHSVASTCAIDFVRYNGTYASPTAVASGDTMGQINYQGYDGTTNAKSARVRAAATEAWTASAHGTKLQFFTTANGTTLNSAKVEVLGDGSLVYGGVTLSPSVVGTGSMVLQTGLMLALAMSNVAVNGAVDVSQELGTTGATLVNNTAKYTADQWEGYYNHGAATAVVTSGQVAAASFGAVLAGFSNGHRIKATTAISSPANGDFARHRQKIEGYRVAKWGWGATGAVSIVVAFRLYSTASGTGFVRLSNSAANRFYYHEVTVAAGWNVVSFAVAGDTSGTWLVTTGVGLVFEFFSAGKEATPQSSLDTWGATGKVQTTNSGNLLGTNNDETVITGLYIGAGSALPVAADFPQLMRPFAQELELCQRYWEKSYNYADAVQTNTGAGDSIVASLATSATSIEAASFFFKRPKRAAPTVTSYRRDGSGSNPNYWRYNVATYAAVTITNVSETQFLALFSGTAAGLTAGNAALMDGHWTADARL